MKIIVLNGPPRVGKDTCAKFIIKEFADVRHLKFSYYLKKQTLQKYGVVPYGANHYVLEDALHEMFEVFKDIPLPSFNFMTPRQALIKLDDNLVNEIGEGYLIKEFARSLPREGHVIVSDSGKFNERKYFSKYMPDAEFHIIKLFRDNFTFRGDSRQYHEKDPNCPHRVHEVYCAPNEKWEDNYKLTKKIWEILC